MLTIKDSCILALVAIKQFIWAKFSIIVFDITNIVQGRMFVTMDRLNMRNMWFV